MHDRNRIVQIRREVLDHLGSQQKVLEIALANQIKFLFTKTRINIIITVIIIFYLVYNLLQKLQRKREKNFTNIYESLLSFCALIEKLWLLPFLFCPQHLSSLPCTRLCELSLWHALRIRNIRSLCRRNYKLNACIYLVTIYNVLLYLNLNKYLRFISKR